MANSWRSNLLRNSQGQTVTQLDPGRYRIVVDVTREAELLRVQAGLAAQQESIRRRERALEDEARLREREAALPAVPYVSFTDGLDAFTGGRSRSA